MTRVCWWAAEYPSSLITARSCGLDGDMKKGGTGWEENITADSWFLHKCDFVFVILSGNNSGE